MRAVPILVLEKWEREGGAPGADRLTTDEIQRELLARGLLEEQMPPQAAGAVVGGFVQKQIYRNLAPPFVVSVDRGVWHFNVRYYESELRKFRERHSIMGEGALVPARPEQQVSVREDRGAQPRSLADKILQAVQEYERDWQQRLQDADKKARALEQAIERLTEENQKLQAEWVAMQAPEPRIADEELRNDCAEFLKREDTYIDAIRRAGVVLEERLKKTIGGDGPEKFRQGVKLVDYALQKDSGRLVISEHPAEQEGVHMLFRGAVQFVRNPPSHKKLRYTEFEARQAVSLIDYLLSLLRQAKPREG